MPSFATPSRAAGRILDSDNRRSTKLWAKVRASRRLRSYKRDSSTEPSVIRPFPRASSIPTGVIGMVAGATLGQGIVFCRVCVETTFL